MRTYPVNKKINQQPKVLGMPLKVFGAFILLIMIPFVIFKIIGFTLVLFGVWVAIDIVIYILASLVSEHFKILDKMLFAKKFKAICNKSIKPFLVNKHDSTN